MKGRDMTIELRDICTYSKDSIFSFMSGTTTLLNKNWITITIMTNRLQNTPRADENLSLESSLGMDKGSRIKNYLIFNRMLLVTENKVA
jgi:hypothetical protein